MTEPIADVATAIALGQRQRQEDAVIANFANGADSGFAVLSDGMGGHDDGDLAARIIVSEVFGAFNIASRTASKDQATLRERLRQAILIANQSLRDQVDAGVGQEGMGGTVITAFIRDDTMSWISIGDSALYLFREDQLQRLNEVHSLAPQIDLLLEQGAIDEETARNHPQRSCLTSALVGAAINLIDCPADPLPLLPGDIIVMASDGLEVLREHRIREILSHHRHASSQQIARALMEAVAEADSPEQDNTSVIVIKPAFADMEHTATRSGAVADPRFLDPVRGSLFDLRQNITAMLTGRSAL
ncbi:PP2C family protein-serine/threonine phosphatase [Primorskyibacter sp. 2E107]|uniref:PP2C family protein-serine/threonine phosphatase n=1 Tax=Primorskyibacter sp. 2E107 TaxID=3403458 RepID=UPI003AF58020